MEDAEAEFATKTKDQVIAELVAQRVSKLYLRISFLLTRIRSGLMIFLVAITQQQIHLSSSGLFLCKMLLVELRARQNGNRVQIMSITVLIITKVTIPVVRNLMTLSKTTQPEAITTILTQITGVTMI